MSKYDALWAWIRDHGSDHFHLTFEEIGRIAGLPIDHAFLTFKKELEAYGYQVGRISMKQQTVEFRRLAAASPAQDRVQGGSTHG